MNGCQGFGLLLEESKMQALQWAVEMDKIRPCRDKAAKRPKPTVAQSVDCLSVCTIKYVVVRIVH